MSQRIQRRRERGWRMPEGAIYVGRPTRWGNPFVVVGGSVIGRDWATVRSRDLSRPVRRKCGHRGVLDSCVPEVLYSSHAPRSGAITHAVELFDTYCAVTERDQPDQFRAWLAPLRGHDLACWCSLDQPCHADVLLELVNG